MQISILQDIEIMFVIDHSFDGPCSRNLMISCWCFGHSVLLPGREANNSGLILHIAVKT